VCSPPYDANVTLSEYGHDSPTQLATCAVLNTDKILLPNKLAMGNVDSADSNDLNLLAYSILLRDQRFLSTGAGNGEILTIA
jgi:hypothetical protein